MLGPIEPPSFPSKKVKPIMVLMEAVIFKAVELKLHSPRFQHLKIEILKVCQLLRLN